VPRLVGGKEQRKLRDVLRLADTSQAVLRHRLLADLLRRRAARGRALLEQLPDAVGLGGARMDHVDVDAVALAEAGEPLGEVGAGGIHRAADQEQRVGGARRTADDADDAPLGRLEHRPEQFGETHGREVFQREAVMERRIGHFEEIAAARRTGIVHQHVAASELVPHEGVQRLAGFERLQVAREGEGFWPGIADRGRGRIEIGLRGGGEHGLRPFARERGRDRAPDAAAAAADHHDPVGEFAHRSRPL
jgi:hypothetical protein